MCSSLYTRSYSDIGQYKFICNVTDGGNITQYEKLLCNVIDSEKW